MYNEGCLVGEWLALPATKEELRACLDRIGIDKEHEEYFITDYETDIEGLSIGEYEPLPYLNKTMKLIEEELTDDELIALQAFLVEGYDLTEALEAAEAGNWVLYSGVSDLEELAEAVIEKGGYLDGLPAIIADHIDYEGVGRDLSIQGHYVFVGGDCVEVHR